jgi:hypothetical protein
MLELFMDLQWIVGIHEHISMNLIPLDGSLLVFSSVILSTYASL